MSSSVKYLSQEEATNIDLELFNEYGFSVDQASKFLKAACGIKLGFSFGMLRTKSDVNRICQESSEERLSMSTDQIRTYNFPLLQ